MRYKAVSLIVAALILSLAVACSSTSGGVSIDLVPQQANAVGHIDVGQLLSDSDLISIYDALPKDPDNPQTFEAALNTFQDETGVDPRDFDEVFIFGDTSTRDDDDTSYGGMIGIGTFDEADFIGGMEDATGVSFVVTTHEGYDMYVAEDEDAAVAFLDDETVVIGTIEAVTDVIDVKVGKESPMDGEVVNAFAGLGTGLAKLAASVREAVTEETLQGANETLPMPVDLSSLDDAQLAEFTFTRDGDEITAQLRVSFSSSSSAKDAKGLVSMVKAFVGTYGAPGDGVGGIQLPEGGSDLIPQLLTELKAEVDGSDLTITLTMTLEEIDQMLSQGAVT